MASLGNQPHAGPVNPAAFKPLAQAAVALSVAVDARRVKRIAAQRIISVHNFKLRRMVGRIVALGAAKGNLRKRNPAI